MRETPPLAVKTLTKEERLGRLGRLLKAERNPYYVTHPIPPHLHREFPCEGWYWIPTGERRVQLLGRDSYDAYHQLLLQLEAVDSPKQSS